MTELLNGTYFLKAGAVTFDQSALTYMQQILEAFAAARPGVDLVVAAQWTTSNVLGKPDGTEIDMGAGLSAGGYDAKEVPAEAIVMHGAMKLAANIPADVLSAAQHKIVVANDSGPFDLRLT